MGPRTERKERWCPHCGFKTYQLRLPKDTFWRCRTCQGDVKDDPPPPGANRLRQFGNGMHE